MEHSRFTSENKGTVGWGPMDFAFEREAAVIKVSDWDEEEMEELKKGKLVEDYVTDILHEINDPDPELEDLETKFCSAKQTIFQLAAQLYDLGVAYQETHPTVPQFEIKGILSTGRVWRFFTLLFSPNLPLMKFDGQLLLHALKSPEVGPQPSKKRKLTRRFSGLYADEEVSLFEVKEIMKAMIILMNRTQTPHESK